MTFRRSPPAKARSNGRNAHPPDAGIAADKV
jgi:hypothetical protein